LKVFPKPFKETGREAEMSARFFRLVFREENQLIPRLALRYLPVKLAFFTARLPSWFPQQLACQILNHHAFGMAFAGPAKIVF
jgi:hypothetical protein